MFGYPWHVSLIYRNLQLDAATKKVQQEVKQLAKKGDGKNARILAREVVRSHKQKDRLSVSKARLGSISHQLQEQLCAVFWISMVARTLIYDEQRWPRLQDLYKSRPRS